MTEPAPPAIGPNPYPGPIPFGPEDSHRFFGRSVETRQLADLVVARRIVLFYAQSGAGKTSLLQAGVIPRLQERRRLRVLPVARLAAASPAPPAEPPANAYAAQLLASLAPSQRPTDAPVSLADGLVPVLAEADAQAGRRGPRPQLLIVDQFEEIFTQPESREGERAQFFQQLQQALAQHPRLLLLLSMREDFIAQLDFYAGLLPQRLGTRFRMERLTRDGALEAIVGPAEGAGRSFELGVAEALVDDLRRVQSRRPSDPAAASAPADNPPARYGEYVEPVYLQIVCRDMWDRLPPERRVIRRADAEAAADVSEALSRFYRSALQKAQATASISERQLRHWFEARLITPARTRGLLYRGAHDTDGLANPAVQALQDAYILRAVERDDDTYIELAHDRLLEPILSDNAAWQAEYFNPLAGPTEAWQASGQQPGHLLRGTELATAERYATAHPQELLESERKFLEASQQQRRRQRQLLALGGLALAFLLLIGGLGVWLRQVQLQNDLAKAELQLRQEQIQRQEAENQRLAAERQRQQAIAKSRQLAGRAGALLAENQRSAALNGALEAGAVYSTTEAFSAIRAAIAEELRPIRQWDTGRPGRVDQLLWSPVAPLLLRGDQAGFVSLWNAESGQALLDQQAHSDGVEVAAWRPDGAAFLTGGRAGNLLLWQMPASGQLSAGDVRAQTVGSFADGFAGPVAWHPDSSRFLLPVGDAVQVRDGASGALLAASSASTETLTLALWSPNGRYFLSADKAGGVYLWDGATGDPLPLPPGHSRRVRVAAWLDDSWAVTADKDGLLWLWDAAAGTGEGIDGGIGDLRELVWLPQREPPLLVAFNRDGQGRAWPLQAGVTTTQILTPHLTRIDFVGHGGVLRDVQLEPGGPRLLTADRNQQMRVWDVASGGTERLLLGHTGNINTARWSADSSRILSASDDGTVRVWGVAGQAEAFRLEGHGGAVRFGLWGPGPDQFVTAANDGTVRLWQFGERAELPVYRGHSGFVRVAFWLGDARIVSAGEEGAAIWDAATGETVCRLSHDGQAVWRIRTGAGGRLVTAGDDSSARVWDRADCGELAVLRHDAPVLYARWDMAGDVLVSGDADGVVKVWDGRTYQHRFDLSAVDDDPATDDLIETVRWRKDATGSQIATASRNGRVQLWDSANGDALYELPVALTAAEEALWRGDGSQLLVYGEGTAADGTKTGVAFVWDAAARALAFELNDPQAELGPVTFGRWSRDESQLLTGHAGGAVRYWDANTGRLLRTFDGHTGRVNTSRLIRADSQLLTAGQDGTVRLWDVASGAEILQILGHSGPVKGASFRAESNQILSWGDDGTARLWDADTGEELATLRGHDGPILGAGWSGSQILTRGTDGTVRRYFTAMADLLEAGCAFVAVPMAPEQRRTFLGAEEARTVCEKMGAVVP